MGTEKRERQKANRQLRLEQLAKEQHREQNKRRALQVGIGVAAAVVIALLFFVIGGGGDDNSPTSTTTAASSSDSVPADGAAAAEEPAVTVPGTSVTGVTPCPAADGSSARVTEFEQAPPNCLTAGAVYTADVATNRGDFTITLDPQKAPLAANNFVVLARYHYFDGIVCHRIITGFVVQCGDPTATGSGGPGYTFDDELPASTADYLKYTVAMANSGPNTNGSQFFVVTGGPDGFANPDYSVFGQVTDGQTTVDSSLDTLGSAGGAPTALVQILSVTINEA